MKPKTIVIALLAASVLGAAGYALYSLGMKQGMQMAAAPAPTAAKASGEALKAGDVDPATGKKVLYWHDPMVPGKRFDKPGKSPFMDMMLVPVYADGDGDQSQVTVSPRVQQNLGMRTAEVKRGSMAQRVEAVGTIAFNERDQAVVQARATGFVERLYVRATLDRVGEGRAAGRAVRAGLGGRAGRIPGHPAHAGHGSRAVDRRRAAAHAPGRNERRANPAGRTQRRSAAAHHADRAHRRRRRGAAGARRHDGHAGRDAVPHQRSRDGMGQRRGAGKPGVAAARRRGGRGALARSCPARCSRATCRRSCPRSTRARAR